MKARQRERLNPSLLTSSPEQNYTYKRGTSLSLASLTLNEKVLKPGLAEFIKMVGEEYAKARRRARCCRPEPRVRCHGETL
jgi:hypothetical protein